MKSLILEAGKARVEELRARVEGFGAVNMMALEELSEAEERLIFLTGQRQDITEGIASTEEALREIKRRSRERFRHAFEQINRNFGQFFQELFGGGRGEMSLIDADDVLESGIDIVAQPPGKRLQNVLLLSGGEKAMAALALVLGIFHYRPSPFCLLDEVDAPLDEANVGRFVDKVAADVREHAVHRHHAQQADDGDGARTLRRDDGGGGRLEARLGEVRVRVRKLIRHAVVAALLIVGAAICAVAQNGNNPQKQNRRSEEDAKVAPPSKAEPADDAVYAYEFHQPAFFIRHVKVRHDSAGRGEITFERQGDLEQVVEPLELSETSLARIKGLWDALRFMDSTATYQADRDYSHLGTVRLMMTRGGRTREAEFNWTADASAKGLADEYRRVSNQSVFVFNMGLARQLQPLNSPKLMERLDKFLSMNELTDPQQLVPLLRELSTDERLPLMARNHAGRILKKLEK